MRTAARPQNSGMDSNTRTTPYTQTMCRPRAGSRGQAIRPNGQPWAGLTPARPRPARPWVACCSAPASPARVLPSSWETGERSQRARRQGKIEAVPREFVLGGAAVLRFHHGGQGRRVHDHGVRGEPRRVWVVLGAGAVGLVRGQPWQTRCGGLRSQSGNAYREISNEDHCANREISRTSSSKLRVNLSHEEEIHVKGLYKEREYDYGILIN
jgi:hypothetical protein